MGVTNRKRQTEGLVITTGGPVCFIGINTEITRTKHKAALRFALYVSREVLQ